METGFNPIPLNEHTPWVIARKDKLVVEVKEANKRYIVISKANDPKVKYDATVEVDAASNLLKSDPKWSEEKEQYLQLYLTKYQKEYVELLKETMSKRQEIVG